ncbi:MAG: IPT/TIG domain-containing protein, partial [Acidobacteria bacterium]|nr:IPT/TIG domain-containing protein [Acidobacteriota bacterium]
MSPSISRLSRNSGAVGTTLTIYGSNFGKSPDAGQVSFHGIGAGAVLEWSDDRITVRVPPEAVTGDVTVSSSGRTSPGKPFTVIILPRVLSVSPGGGSPGTQVTITGSGFGAEQRKGSVWLGTAYGTVVSWSDDRIVATLAAQSRSGVVRVQQRGNWSRPVSFPVDAATIASVWPPSGKPETEVTIRGVRFGDSQGQGRVWLGTVPAIVQRWSDTEIVARVAPGAMTGKVRVLAGATWSNPVSFTVETLHIASTTPAAPEPSGTVTIAGSGFGSERGSGSLLLGGVEARVERWSDTEIVAAVPPDARKGVARVRQDGVWSNALRFSPRTTGSDGVTLAPDTVNLVVGEVRTLQATGADGQPATGLTWTSSDSAVVSLSSAYPPELTALSPGHVTITAGSATADVTVYADALPLGTVIWSNPGNGSGVLSITPAVPSASGVADVFAFQGDGTVQAITSDGLTSWSANVGYPYAMVPDFQGGLVVNDGSIRKLDGLTGQAYPAYTPDD